VSHFNIEISRNHTILERTVSDKNCTCSLKGC